MSNVLLFTPHLGNVLTVDITIDYTNWRGQRYKRRITPKSISWGSNSWHPEPQFLMLAWCHVSKAEKCFAVKNIHSWEESPIFTDTEGVK